MVRYQLYPVILGDLGLTNATIFSCRFICLGAPARNNGSVHAVASCEFGRRFATRFGNAQVRRCAGCTTMNTLLLGSLKRLAPPRGCAPTQRRRESSRGGVDHGRSKRSSRFPTSRRTHSRPRELPVGERKGGQETPADAPLIPVVTAPADEDRRLLPNPKRQATMTPDESGDSPEEVELTTPTSPDTIPLGGQETPKDAPGIPVVRRRESPRLPRRKRHGSTSECPTRFWGSSSSRVAGSGNLLRTRSRGEGSSTGIVCTEGDGSRCARQLRSR